MQPYPSIMMQSTVNERLKILINVLGQTVRAFSAKLEVSESTTRNYLDKGTKLNSEYFERIAHHFKQADLNWLITGEGQPLVPGAVTADYSTTHVKNNSGNTIGTNKGTAHQHGGTGPDYRAQLDAAQKEIAHLHAQLTMKDALIAAKDETITLLKSSYTRPN